MTEYNATVIRSKIVNEIMIGNGYYNLIKEKMNLSQKQLDEQINTLINFGVIKIKADKSILEEKI